MRIKKIMAVLLTMGFSISMIACGSGSTKNNEVSKADLAEGKESTKESVKEGKKEEASGEKVKLDFIQWWVSENGGPTLEALVADFEKENPNIDINMITLPFGDVRNQVVASQASKSVPDLIAMNPPWTREFSDLGILTPLDDLMANDPNYKKEDFMGASFTPIEGKTYLAPVNSMAFYLFYNKKMFKDAGLELPKTWADIEDCAKKLTDPNNNKYGITLTMAEQEASNGSILTLYPLLYALNGRTYIDDKFTVKTDEMLKSFELLQHLAQNQSILPGTTSRSEFQNTEEFSTGNVGMMISHNGHILTVKDRNPELDFGVMPIPSYDGKGKPELRHHGWDIAISEACKHKEEAWKFISYISQKSQMTKMCDEMLKFPTRFDVEVSWPKGDPILEQALKDIKEYSLVEELMTMPKSSACWVDLTKAGSAVIQGAMTPEEAVNTVQKQWDEKLGQ